MSWCNFFNVSMFLDSVGMHTGWSLEHFITMRAWDIFSFPVSIVYVFQVVCPMLEAFVTSGMRAFTCVS